MIKEVVEEEIEYYFVLGGGVFSFLGGSVSRSVGRGENQKRRGRGRAGSVRRGGRNTEIVRHQALMKDCSLPTLPSVLPGLDWSRV